jgi:GWxTD domain-containing protein
MNARSFRLALLGGALAVWPALATAQKLDKDDKTFLDGVKPIMLAEEEKVYRGLKERSDRLEFQKIFWGRRDPDLATPANEYQAQYEKARAEADRLYKMPTQPGSLTDCGRVFILLGKPDEVKQEGSTSPGLRVPETWTYKDNGSRTFTGGKATIAFDEECRAPGSLAAQMDRVAAEFVKQPNLDYKKDKDGRLVKLADMLPKDSPARALAKQPRQDFAIGVQPAFLKVADGGTALLGLVRGDAAGLAASEGPAGKTVSVAIGASAVTADGKEAAWAEQATAAPVGPDGAFLASFKLALRPGKYTLKAGAVEAKSGKGSLVSIPIEVPDFSKVDTAADGTTAPAPTAASLLFVAKVDDLPAGSKEDPSHPFAAFELGQMRLHPYFGSAFAKSDELNIMFQVYDLSVDKATGKANATATLSILKDGTTPVAKLDQPMEGAIGGGLIGPVPLSGYAPGKYVVQLKVADRISKKEVVQEVPLEVKP